ncbi:TlpA disulfide reductase family protein [Nannocystis punicea]|uniref:TlpA disulfide reductase family protein n=1 Tax=Nannocystis punicea TaxID=2995304 RepID=A0ABY7H765_9BACT|nr:TlpA disulfide reductase family protein [Nannocystis poenicansa]WAS95115.1 TlpA disulfide reductase family protein [Nannocystis poenicansa]
MMSLLSAACGERSEAEPRAAVITRAAAADGAAAQVRRAYLGRDYWACARDGAALRLVHPDSAPLQAWTILCVARSGVDAVPLAEAMLAERPGDPWALFARAGALVDHPGRGAEEAAPAARVALAAMPDHPDAVWLLGRALVVHAPRDEAAAFFAERPQPAPADLVALELAFAAQQPEATESRVSELAARVRAADPGNVDAEFMTATWQLQNSRASEAEASLRRALELSPHSPALHSKLWQAIRLSPVREAADRRAAIDADVALLLRHRGDAPAALQAAAYVYTDMAPETYQELTAELLARFPDSAEADWARYGQILALDEARYGREGRVDPAADAEELRLLDAFLARRVIVTRLLADVTRMRYGLLSQAEGVSSEQQLAALQAWARHDRINVHGQADAVARFSARTDHDAEAEAIARLILEHGEARLAEQRRIDPSEVDAGSMLTPLYAALATTLQAQGRDGEAREVLGRGRAHRYKAPEFLVQLAAVAEADGNIDEAEQWLVEGLSRWGGEAVCGEALRQLYRRQHGSERGYAEHRARLEVEHVERRRAALLAKSAVAEPQALRPFVLAKVGGGERDSASLRGKLGIINFWSRNCGPCVREMPALQQLADALAGSPDVVVTTVNADDDPAGLAEWMTGRELRLEVLLGARYFNDLGYRGVPQTLFVAPDGRVLFAHEGAPARLVEEFGWYVEATRERAAREAGASLHAAG